MSGDGTPDWGAIQVRGARENNLRDVDIDRNVRNMPPRVNASL